MEGESIYQQKKNQNIIRIFKGNMQFTDNRELSVKQAKLMESTLDVKSGKIFQLSPVSSNELNVIGEDHDESDCRRSLEKRYLKGKGLTAGYWVEMEFKDGKKTGIIDRRKQGDPTLLHIQYLVTALTEILVEKARKHPLKVIKDDFYKEAINWAWDSLDSFIWGIGGVIRTDFFDLADDEVAMVRHNFSLFETAKSQKGKLDNAFSSGNVQYSSREITEFTTALIDFKDGLYPNKENSATVDKNRNQSIHTTAQNNSTIKGAWKIGDNHAKKLNTDRNYLRKTYNLVTLTEFNSEFSNQTP